MLNLELKYYIGNKTFLQGGVKEIESLFSISCRKYITNYIIQSSVNTIRDNIHLIPKLKSQGVKFIELGIESFSKNTLHRLGKNVDIHSLPLVLKVLHDSGIKVIGNFMLGIKGDTSDDYYETITNIDKYKKYFYSLNITNYSDYNSVNPNDRDERVLIKSWITDDNIENTKIFAENMYRLNYEIITQ